MRLVPLKLIEEKVRENIQNDRERGSSFFNNFHGNLPGGYRRVVALLDKNYSDERNSKRLQNMTRGEFYEEIDEVMKGVGITKENIIEAKEKFFNSNSNVEVFDLFLPIYSGLRELGYKHYPDLTA